MEQDISFLNFAQLKATLSQKEHLSHHLSDHLLGCGIICTQVIHL